LQAKARRDELFEQHFQTKRTESFRHRRRHVHHQLEQRQNTTLTGSRIRQPDGHRSGFDKLTYQI
jgi:hypothetical protein